MKQFKYQRPEFELLLLNYRRAEYWTKIRQLWDYLNLPLFHINCCLYFYKRYFVCKLLLQMVHFILKVNFHFIFLQLTKHRVQNCKVYNMGFTGQQRSTSSCTYYNTSYCAYYNTSYCAYYNWAFNSVEFFQLNNLLTSQ